MKIIIYLFLFFCIRATSQPIDLPVSLTGDDMRISPVAADFVVGTIIPAYYLTLVPDFERLNVSVIGNQMTISRMASGADIGKIVAVKGARYYPAFRQASIAWNGVVTGVTNGKLVLGSGSYGDDITQLINVSNVECEIGTNQWSAINTAHALAIAAGFKKIVYNWNGVVAVNPLLSSSFRTQFPENENAIRGWQIDTDSIVISGLDSSLTIIKYMCEDRADITDNDGPLLFYVYANSAALAIEKLTIRAPDRASTMNITNIGFIKNYSGQRSVYIRRVNVLCDLKFGFEDGVVEDNSFGVDGSGINGHPLYVWAENSTLQLPFAFTVFNQSDADKRLIVKNVKIDGSGKRKYFDPYINAVQAEYNGGEPFVTINNPNASFIQARHPGADGPEWNKKPWCMFFPLQEQQSNVVYKFPGSSSTPGEPEYDSYGHGAMYLEAGTVNLLDGNEHFVRVRWLNDVNQVIKYITDVNGVFPRPGNNPYLSKLYYKQGGAIYTVNDQNNNGGRLDEVIRNIETGLSVRLQFVEGELKMLAPLSAYAIQRPGDAPNQAHFFSNHFADNNDPPYSTIPVTADFINKVNGGTILMVGRFKASNTGFGHAFYVHSNVSIYIDGCYLNMSGQMGQSNDYAFRMSSNVTGTAEAGYYIRRWFGTPSRHIYFNSSGYYQQPQVEFQGSGLLSPATIGSSVFQYNPLIQVPYNLVQD